MEGKEFLERRWFTHPRVIFPLVAGVITVIDYVLLRAELIPQIVGIFGYIIAIATGGYHWIKEGVEELWKEGKVSIEVLMISATFGAAILGMWSESAFLVFLYGIAEGLEEYTYEKTKASIKSLLDLAPKEARVIESGSEKKIPVDEIKIGDIILVKPGEAIPTDGVIIEGRSSVDEAPITGESIPVDKKEGMTVFAGSINQEGMLKIKATASFKDNTLSRIIHFVEEAQERKGRVQLLIEKFGRIYTPFILVGGFLLFFIPFLLGMDYSVWGKKAVTLLVASAPCALVISTPVTLIAGIGRAGMKGVLIKGGVYLELLSKVKVIAFDKTGTLTKGEPSVTDIINYEGSEEELLQIAASIEKYSEHPIAKAVLKEAKKRGVETLAVSDFSTIPGYGAFAVLNGEVVYVGKEGLFSKMSVSLDNSSGFIRKFSQEGKTVMLVGTNKKVKGIMALRDTLRDEVKDVINTLHREGIKTAILTGDSELTARAIAGEAGIDEVKAELKPEEKAMAIRELKDKYEYVAMVGDGINDAPALSEASVGIAMGTGGTDVAIESADVALIGDKLEYIPFILKLSRRVRIINLQNIIFSIFMLAILIPSALMGWITIAGAVFFHELSELIAVANGLRARR